MGNTFLLLLNMLNVYKKELKEGVARFLKKRPKLAIFFLEAFHFLLKV